jgi:hypothetical protein
MTLPAAASNASVDDSQSHNRPSPHTDRVPAIGSDAAHSSVDDL